MSAAGSSINSPFDMTELAKFGQRQVDALIGMQRELCSLAEQANRDWIARVEREQDLTSELATKLSAARTLPDAAKAYQEWVTRHMETLSEDGRTILVGSQKLAASTARLFANGPAQGFST